jgi:1-acyl-sn-glycerol-3-phosphate acyltransferase
LEEIAGRVEGVRAGCVVAFGAPDERTGTERLVVTAEVRDMADADRITAEIGRTVDEAMGMPLDVVELLAPQSIPKTSSGKLRRSETRRLYLEGKLGKKVAPAWVQIGRLAVYGAVPRAWAWLKRIAGGAVDLVYGVYGFATLTLGLLPIWLVVVLARDRKRAAQRTHTGARWLLRAAGIPVHIEGGEILDELGKTGPWIFAPNHSSYIDILVSLAVLPDDVRFVAKGESLSMPVVGTIIRRSGQFGFDRGDPHARIRQAEEVNVALRKGESVGIYPEGTFTPITGIRPFQLGAFKAAVDTQRPICPVAVHGAREILRDKTYLPRRGRVTVTLGPLVMPDPSAGDDWHEIVRLRDSTREIIAQHAGEPLL